MNIVVVQDFSIAKAMQSDNLYAAKITIAPLVKTITP